MSITTVYSSCIKKCVLVGNYNTRMRESYGVQDGKCFLLVFFHRLGVFKVWRSYNNTTVIPTIRYEVIVL